MGAREDRQADRVGVLLEDGLGDLLGGLEQARVDDLEPGVAQGPGDHLDAPVVPVEAGFGHDDSMAALHGRDTTRVPRDAPQSPRPARVSPVERGGSHAGRALAVSAVAIAAIGLILFLAATVLSDRNSTELRPRRRRPSRAGTPSAWPRRSTTAARSSTPTCRGSKERDLILQHLGDEPEHGAGTPSGRQPPTRTASAPWQWQRGRGALPGQRATRR